MADLRFRALHPIDRVNYTAVLDDGSLVHLLWRKHPGGGGQFEVWDLNVADKRRTAWTDKDVCVNCGKPLSATKAMYLDVSDGLPRHHMGCPPSA